MRHIRARTSVFHSLKYPFITGYQDDVHGGGFIFYVLDACQNISVAAQVQTRLVPNLLGNILLHQRHVIVCLPLACHVQLFRKSYYLFIHE